MSELFPTLARMFSPEFAHKAALFALKTGLLYTQNPEIPSNIRVNFFNNSLRTPVGLAAGFDKNGDVIYQINNMGFGYTEVGTVTLKPRYGNKKPRVFRLHEEKAIINSMGFPNDGVNHMIRNAVNKQEMNTCMFGINIGRAHSASGDLVSDYIKLVKKVYGFSNYIAINISSPNTPGLLDLQKKENLRNLVSEIKSIRKSIDYAESIPFFIKISPDVDEWMQNDIAEVLLDLGVEGLIVGNTSIDLKKNLRSFYSKAAGGLSGKPIFERSTNVLANMYKLTGGKLIMIGCGGIFSARDAYTKIQAGASLLQLYTAIVYQGFDIIHKINRELSVLVEKDGFRNVSEAVGCIH